MLVRGFSQKLKLLWDEQNNSCILQYSLNATDEPWFVGIRIRCNSDSCIWFPHELECHAPGRENFTFIFSTSWSTPLSPGKIGYKFGLSKEAANIAYHRFGLIGKQWRKLYASEKTCPRSSSVRTHPTDHMSIAVVYSVAPNMSSGAL